MERRMRRRLRQRKSTSLGSFVFTMPLLYNDGRGGGGRGGGGVADGGWKE